MITFDASNIISYEKFDRFLTNRKKLFEAKKISLFEEFDILKHVTWDENKTQFMCFRRTYNILVRETVYAVIDYYRAFLPKECLIVEFGSFVKGTERILSDIDLTICYDEEKTADFECAEMLINYSITHILGFSIDHIHGKFQHYPLMHDFDNLTEEDNHYRFSFIDHQVDFKCGPETLQENLMNIKNVRDYQSMIEGYEEKYLLKCNIDCLYSIDVIENSMKHDFIGDLALLEHQYDICSDYVFNTSPSTLSDPFSISDLKKILKYSGVVEFYIFLAKLRKFLSLVDEYSMDIESLRTNRVLYDYFGEKYVFKLFDSFLKFIFYWNRVELSFNVRGIALSTRCNKEYSHEAMNSLLCDDWREAIDIQSLLTVKNELTSVIKTGLEKIKNTQ